MVVHARYPIGETRVEREACALENHGFKVDVICLQGKGEPVHETVDRINIYRLPINRHRWSNPISQLIEYLTFFVLASIKLMALHHRRHYHVVQAHNLPDWLVFVGLFPKLTGARVILDLHDLMPEFYTARFNRSLTSWPVRFLIWQERLSCRFADHVITVTDAWRETLIKRGLAPTKVSVVMNVADERIFYRSEESQNLNPGNSHFRLLYHGNLTHRYGVDTAIRAIDLVREQIPGIHLHIHGWGDARQDLLTLCDELGLNEYVSFSTQSLLTSELPGLIMQADVCLVPYRRDIFTDGILPTKLLEYAALGMPVVAAQTPAIARYFDDTMVQFFPPGDIQRLAHSLCTLSTKWERLAELGKGIRKFGRRYNWMEQSALYVDLVDRLAQGRRARHE